MRINEHRISGDERGLLIAIEGERQVPFVIKRVFYIYGNNENIPRGNHSHFKTKQYLISIAGSCKVTLDDGKGNKVTYDLDKPNKGLFQDSLIWGTMHDFSKDNILLVIANEQYNKDDYITNYKDFLDAVNTNNAVNIDLNF